MSELDNDLSGAPDKDASTNQEAIQKGVKTPQPVWDENNRLVDPVLDAHFKTEHARVLGTLPLDDKNVSEGQQTPAKVSPEEYQAGEGATAEPMTSPQPSHDPVQAPTGVFDEQQPAEVEGRPIESFPIMSDQPQTSDELQDHNPSDEGSEPVDKE